MINLLPYDIKKALHADYRHRLYILGFFFVVIALSILLIVLGLIYFLLIQNTSPQNAKTPLVGETKEELLQELKNAQEGLSFFSAEGEGYIPTELFKETTTGGGSYIGVFLTEFSYTENKGKPSVVLEGNAKTRESLVSFLDRLRTKTVVDSIESPISNLSKRVDIPFSVTIHLKPYVGKK